MGFFNSLFGGPSNQMKNIAAATQQASSDQLYDANVSFGDAQSMMKSIQGQIASGIATGFSQYGFPSAVESAMRTQLATSMAQAGTAESQAVNESLASRGVTPGSGISSAALASIEGALANQTASQLAMGQLGITEKNYDEGRANFSNLVLNPELQMTNTESGLASNMARAGNEAGSTAFGEAKTIQSMNPLSNIMAAAGDIGGAFIGDPNLGNQLTGKSSAPSGGMGGSGGGIAGGFANLDNTGGSSFGEQVGNFLSGSQGQLTGGGGGGLASPSSYPPTPL